jgi:Flp pilus assembly protein TadB
MTRKSFLAILLIGLFSIFGVNYALAEGYPTKEENANNLKEGIEHAKAGLEAAQAGDAAGCADHVKAARDSLKEINASDAKAAELRKGRSPLQTAWAKCKKGDPATAAPLIEGAIEHLNKVSL